MGKVFEDYFAELHTDMVFACKDYVNGAADKIYIYISQEGRMTSSDYFFEIEGQILKRHQLNSISKQYDISVSNQQKCNVILVDTTLELEDLCQEYQRPMPTEIKMIYDVKKNSLDVKYKYDNQWLNHKTKSPDDIANKWFEEVKNSKK